jgi:hypothetical protein
MEGTHCTSEYVRFYATSSMTHTLMYTSHSPPQNQYDSHVLTYHNLLPLLQGSHHTRQTQLENHMLSMLLPTILFVANPHHPYPTEPWPSVSVACQLIFATHIRCVTRKLSDHYPPLLPPSCSSINSYLCRSPLIGP